MTYGMVHCFACGDYVYDRELDDIAKKLSRRSSSLLGMVLEISSLINFFPFHDQSLYIFRGAVAQ